MQCCGERGHPGRTQDLDGIAGSLAQTLFIQLGLLSETDQQQAFGRGGLAGGEFAEVERLMNATKRNRWGHRDATMVLVAYRHGLRAAELVDLRWDQVDFRPAAAAGLLVSAARRPSLYEWCPVL